MLATLIGFFYGVRLIAGVFGLSSGRAALASNGHPAGVFPWHKEKFNS